MAEELSPALSPDEIYDLTHYKRPSEQLRTLEKLGIPAMRRHDNTVCVLRANLRQPTAAPEKRPRLNLS